MLRRRLFSAAMASVMALSTVAVVAQAEETTTQVVTKDQLKQQIEVIYGEKYRSEDLDNYRRSAAKNMLDALEAADAILADADSDTDDYTVAYMMVEACANQLKTVSLDDLKELVKKSESIINKGNINSEVLMDAIYADAKFSALDIALDNAKDYLDSTSGADIADAYDKLEAAYKACSKLPSVKKSEFRKVLKEYEAFIADELAYQDWRRGTVAEVADTDGKTTAFIGTAEGATFGVLYEYCEASRPVINSAYDRFDNAKGITETTDDQVIAGYNLAKDLVTLYKSWSVDASGKSTKAGLKNLLNKYHGQLVYSYAKTSAEDLLADLKAEDTNAAGEWKIEYASDVKDHADNAINNRVTKAEYVIKAAEKILCFEITDGYYEEGNTVFAGTREDVQAELAKDANKNKTFVKIYSGTELDITKYIEVTADKVDDDIVSTNTYVDASAEVATVNGTAADITGSGEEYKVTIDQAFELADMYLNEAYKTNAAAVTAAYTAIDDTNKVVQAGKNVTGSSKELEVVYRALEYALYDNFGGKAKAGESYKRADVIALISKAYDLVDLTGDAAIFNAANVELVQARQDALDWVAATNVKGYDDGVAYEYNIGGDTANATEMFKALKGVYDDLEKEYNALKYSFGDVYNKLAETAKAIDAGKLAATDELLAAMEETAYCLSVIPADTILDDGLDTPYEYNYAFDDSRIFEGENRVVTKIHKTESVEIAEIGEGVRAWEDPAMNAEHAKLTAAYENLLKLIDKQTSAPAVLGDANGDGALTAADASAILKASVGLAEIDQKAADHNGDGAVTAADAASILKAIVA